MPSTQARGRSFQSAAGGGQSHVRRHQQAPGWRTHVGAAREGLRAAGMGDSRAARGPRLVSAAARWPRTASPVPRGESFRPAVSALPDCFEYKGETKAFSDTKVLGTSPSCVLSRGCQRTRPGKAMGGSEGTPGHPSTFSGHRRPGACQPQEFILTVLEAASPRPGCQHGP